MTVCVVQTSASLVLSCPGCFLAKSRITSGVLNAWLMAAWIAWRRHTHIGKLATFWKSLLTLDWFAWTALSIQRLSVPAAFHWVHLQVSCLPSWSCSGSHWIHSTVPRFPFLSPRTPPHPALLWNKQIKGWEPDRKIYRNYWWTDYLSWPIIKAIIQHFPIIVICDFPVRLSDVWHRLTHCSAHNNIWLITLHNQ